ncbi:hypothetical protein D3C81_1935880 [compost metagenome]
MVFVTVDFNHSPVNVVVQVRADVFQMSDLEPDLIQVIARPVVHTAETPLFQLMLTV